MIGETVSENEGPQAMWFDGPCGYTWCRITAKHTHTLGALRLRGEVREVVEELQSYEWATAPGRLWAWPRRSGKVYASLVGRERALALGVHVHSVGPGFETCENFGVSCELLNRS